MGMVSLRAASVLTYHNDNVGSSVNASETMLTPSNLTVNTFSKLYSTAVDGIVYAQPLYVPNVTVTGGSAAGIHNLVFIATQHDSLYAIDAQSGAVVWQDSFLLSGLSGATAITTCPATDTGSTDTTPEIGICSTPVIDPSTNLLYVEAKTKQIVNSDTAHPHYVHTLYKIDITNGNASANANIVGANIFVDTIYDGSTYTYRTNSDPTAAQDPFVMGTGDDSTSVNGQNRVYLNGLRHMNRPGLLLTNGTIYVAFASHGDMRPYHGWLLGFSKTTLAINAVLNVTPNGNEGGIWSSGGAPEVDASGNIYLMTGNGTFDGDNSSGSVTGLNGQNFPQNGDFGDCFIKISPDGTSTVSSQNVNGWGLKVADYFAPYNNQNLSANDSDIGAGNCVLLPDSAGSTSSSGSPNGVHAHLMVGAGKQAILYLIDRDSMGKYSTGDNVVQSESAVGGCFDSPAFFNGVLYYIGFNDHGKAFAISNAGMSTSPVSTPDSFSWPGSNPSVSANGTTNGIVWMLSRGTSELRAYSAANLGTEIWTSSLAPSSRDALGTVTKFATPTVADGQVFVGTTTALVTYGLTPTGVQPSVTTSTATLTGTTAVNLAATVNPNGFDTTVSFQYGTTTSYGSTSSTQDAGSGSSTTTVTIGVSGLSIGTTYHYRAVATNTAGTVYGADETFSTPTQPTVATSTAATTGTTSENLNATVNPNGYATTVSFQYGTSTSYGSMSGSQNAGSGTSSTTVTIGISGLSSLTTYHYRAVATNTAGTVYGADSTFTTPAKPTVVTTVATSIGGTAASLNATVTPNGYATTAFFQYGTTTSYGSTSGTQNAGSGSSSTTVTMGISGLSSLTTYHFRAVATNSAGTNYGTDSTFTTSAPPTVTTSAATSISGGSATLGASVTPNGFATNVSFQYGTTTFYGSTSGSQSAGSGTAAVAVTTAVNGLAGQTTYHYRAVATNSAGTVYGADQTFATLAQPTFGANPTVYAGVSDTEISGTINPNGAGTDLYFQYGTSTAYTSQTVGIYVGTGTAPVTINVLLPGLAPSTTYHYRLLAAGVAGTFFGQDHTFTTLPFDSTLEAQVGDSAVGVSGATFLSFGSPAINSHNHIAFKGLLTTGPGGVTTATNRGIWADDSNGNRQLVVRVGTTTAPRRDGDLQRPERSHLQQQQLRGVPGSTHGRDRAGSGTELDWRLVQ